LRGFRGEKSRGNRKEGKKWLDPESYEKSANTHSAQGGKKKPRVELSKTDRRIKKKSYPVRKIHLSTEKTWEKLGENKGE